MADTAFITQYRREFILGFEDMQSRLRSTTVTDAVVKGNTATFLVADSGSAEAVTRGVNGMIPARTDDNEQLSATLQEWHDLVRKTRFNIFASQGDQNALMQKTAMGVINRKMDDDVIAQLDTATNDTGAAATGSLDLVVYAKTILGNNFVDLSDVDSLFAVISPAFEGYLEQIPEYASADYVDVKPLSGAKSRSFRRWMGFNWIVHPRLTGSVGAGGDGTSEQCFFYHRNAIGHAFDKESMSVALGYDDEQDYSYCRMSAFMGSKLLQQSGIVMVKHDGSAYVAQ